MYPTPRLSQAIIANGDVDYQVAMVRAYNDWQAEYVGHAPARFAGLIWLPSVGAEAAVAELERNLGRPGMRGALISAYPNGSLTLKPEDDKVWARIAEAGLPLSIHVSLSKSFPAAHKAKLPGYGRFFDAPNRMIELIFDGVFDRFPELEVVFAEVDCGWVPYVKEQIDNNYSRLDAVSAFGLQQLPSEYIERHFHYGFMTDTFAIDNRQRIGVERILWSSDYPHISSDWPNSWRTIQASFSGVPVEERAAILAGNALRLYGFDR
jgi:predicted TIM-barrel fold metal-dependent hydrolase